MHRGVHGIGKRFVYILHSESANRPYIGVTSDINQRLEWHNSGPCGYTSRYRPWTVVVAIEFPTEGPARDTSAARRRDEDARREFAGRVPAR